ncbi:stigma-specific STIG1-like protein 1 [Carica papaya]|uniref:stigma-specific STIG1-like protein 1 n=1 Tax=Carica papaya TaxID=3649 RepID=UPI000B8CE1BE|nr:stigma-specific STIG1-like protein 1 [Carica papaya]
MEFIMKIVVTIAITVAVTISVTMMSVGQVDNDQIHQRSSNMQNEMKKLSAMADAVPKRVSRFLKETKKPRNPNAADHCHKDPQVCHVQSGGVGNSTCCNNKCLDLSIDKHNCGACKNKCKFMEECCRGQCVNLSFDKRHCGFCNHRCKDGEYCVYGMCNYA